MQGAPVRIGVKKTVNIREVKSSIDLVHSTPPASPLNRQRACSDPNVTPMSHCPVIYTMRLLNELCEITVDNILDKDIPPSPDTGGP